MATRDFGHLGSLSFSSNEVVEGEHYKITVFDKAGQDDYDRIYDRLRYLFYAHTSVVIVAYSIASPSSFKNVSEKWIPEVRCYCPETLMILVGMKEDLRNDTETIECLKEGNESLVTHEMGLKLATDNGIMKFLECSALLDKGLKNVFEEAVRAYHFHLQPPKDPNSCLIILYE